MADRFINVIAPIDFESERINLIEVTLIYGSQRADLVLQPGHSSDKVSFTQDDAHGRTLQYQYRAYSALRASGTQRSHFETPLRTTDSSVLVIDPRELYEVIRVHAVGVFDRERYRTAFVDVKAESPSGGWSSTETQGLDKERGSAAGFYFLTESGSKVSLQQRVRYVTNAGDIVDGPWQPAEPGALLVGNPVTEASGGGR